MEEKSFMSLFREIVELYELSPDAAAELLKSILAILKASADKPLQNGSEYEILTVHRHREETS